MCLDSQDIEKTMGTSILHIMTEVECKVYLYGEERGIAKVDSYFNLKVRKGEQDLLFISTRNKSYRYQLIYNVERSDCDYRIVIRASMFEKIVRFFSVGEGMKVEFAPGNLAEDGKSFVKQQWDIGGKFFWGSWVPTKAISYFDYINHEETEAIADCRKFRDWGENIGKGWRTPSIKEWYYLVYERDNANKKVAIGCINGIYGIILLPDNWEAPDNCSFNEIPSELGQPNYGDIDIWCNNYYSKTIWKEMESQGAIFLPLYKEFLSNWNVNAFFADYWSSTPMSDEGTWMRQSLFLHFDAMLGIYTHVAGRDSEMSVRLIRQQEQ